MGNMQQIAWAESGVDMEIALSLTQARRSTRP